MSCDYTFEECLGIIQENMRVIGLLGNKRSGKTTLANFVERKYGYVHLTFARNIKKSCKNIYHFSDGQINDQKLKETVDKYWGYTPRQFFNIMGTEMFQDVTLKHFPEIGRSLWVRSVVIEMVEMFKKDPTCNRFIIGDVRFPHEMEFLESIGAKVIKIERPTGENHGNHRSETLIKDIEPNHTIVNDDTIDEMLIMFELYLTELASTEHYKKTQVKWKDIIKHGVHSILSNSKKKLYDNKLVLGLGLLSTTLLLDKIYFRKSEVK